MNRKRLNIIFCVLVIGLLLGAAPAHAEFQRIALKTFGMD
jgi:hypothetical protein